MVAKTVLFFMGPTCVGKSSIVLSLFKDFSINFINVDASSIYKNMDIGTAKPNKDILNKIDYHLIDILDPKEKYSVGKFYFDSLRIINDSFNNNKLACFVGGTLMYFWVLKNGLYYINDVNDKKISIFDIYKFHGLDFLIDTCFNIDFNILTKEKISLELNKFFLNETYFYFKNSNFIDFNIVSIVIIPYDKFELFKKIELRLNNMFASGFIDEVYFLYKRGDLTFDMQSIRSIGYRQIWNYLSGNISLYDAKKDIICSTKKLVKRQLTWLKKWDGNTYFFFDNDSNLLSKIKYIVLNIEKRR